MWSAVLHCGLGLAFLCGLAVQLGCAGRGKSAQPIAQTGLTPEQRRLNVESFDVLWRTVRDTHWDPDLGGLDWQAVYDQVRPEVEQARTMAEARAAMNKALARLRQSHFGVIPAEAYESLGVGGHQSLEGTTGLTVRVIDGQVLVVEVRPGSPAAELGVRPGWQLILLGDEEVAPLVQRIAATWQDSTLQQLMLVSAIQRRLAGPVGEPVPASFVAEAGQVVALELPRVVPEGSRVSIGHLPPMHLRLEARRLENNVGYISFNVFLDPERLMAEFERALQSFMDADGVILDLRGNPGGIGAMSMGVAGWFVDRDEQPLGMTRTRQAEIRFAIFPRPNTYQGPLAVLVDGCTASTAEILSGGLQDLGRARIFGSRTAGAALPAQVEKLPNGDGFIHAIADYVSSGGRRLEGVGVIPDVEVPLTRAQLLAGRDPVIEAAAEWIRSIVSRSADSL